MANSKISALTSASTPLAGTEALPIVQSNTTVKTTVAGITKDRTGISVGKSLNAWRTSSDYVVQVGDTAAVFSDSNVTLDLGNNWYLNSSNQYIRNITNGATRVQCYQGNYKFFTAASDSAGTQITWRQDFTITQSSGDVTVNTGNLIQGTAAKGVNFTANTPAAGKTSQLLNWYEEGTWTPSLSFATSGSVTYLNQNGTYTRIGNQVTLNFWIRVNTTSSPLGNTTITGMPFTSGATATRPASALRVNGVTLVGYCVGWISTSTTSITLVDIQTGTSVNLDGTKLNAACEFDGSITYIIA